MEIIIAAILLIAPAAMAMTISLCEASKAADAAEEEYWRNREKYKEQILDIVCEGEGFAVRKETGEPADCKYVDCDTCVFGDDEVECWKERNKWAYQEYKEPKTNGTGKWIPITEKFPETGKCVLISFENCELPYIGTYKEDGEGGMFCVGCSNISCSGQGMYVNAWMPLPEPYREAERNTTEAYGRAIERMRKTNK